MAEESRELALRPTAVVGARRSALLLGVPSGLVILGIYVALAVQSVRARAELTVAQQQFEKVRQEQATLQAEVAQLRTERAELKSENKSLGDDNTRAQRELDEKHKLLESLRQVAQDPSGIARQQILAVLRAETPKERAEALYAAGKISMGNGDNARASQLFEAALTEAPEYPQALNALGRAIVLQGGDKQRAIALYLKTIEVAPAYVYAYHNLANLYFLDKRFAEARRYATAGIQVDPKYTPLQELLAKIDAASPSP